MQPGSHKGATSSETMIRPDRDHALAIQLLALITRTLAMTGALAERRNGARFVDVEDAIWSYGLTKLSTEVIRRFELVQLLSFPTLCTPDIK